MIDHKSHSLISDLRKEILTSTFKDVMFDSVREDNLLEIIWDLDNYSFFSSNSNISFWLESDIPNVVQLLVENIIDIYHLPSIILSASQDTVE